MDLATAVSFGSTSELQAVGQLIGKVGGRPVVVFWDNGHPWAVEDRCPHMGFPLHRGTVDDGVLICHWHHARFDLATGCTFDLWADDVPAFDVSVDDEVRVAARPVQDAVARLERRLTEGLEESLTLVIAKAVHGLLAHQVPPTRIVGIALEFGAANRAEGWGPGLTVAQIVLNLLPHIPTDEHGRALTQGLAFLARDTQGHRPYFPVSPLAGEVDVEQLSRWYRRFVETRSGQAAERVIATLAHIDPAEAERTQVAACTDHIFLDDGHLLDYVNKVAEAVSAIGSSAAPALLPTLVRQSAAAARAEETSEWREPVDLIPIIDATTVHIQQVAATGKLSDTDIGRLGWELLSEDPVHVAAVLVAAAEAGATAEQLARAVAFAAALRLVRFHVQNDVGDWDRVHHTFTTANAVHQAVLRHPTPEAVRGIVHGALRVYLDRFLNVPAARLPTGGPRALHELAGCWDVNGGVDEAGSIVAGALASGRGRDDVIAELCRALLHEDAGFHWFQEVEAGVRQAEAWPDGSEESTLILVGVTRWLAAHTPTIRQTDQVVSITRRLLRGDAVYEDAAP